MTTNPLGASRRVLQPHPDLSLTLIETGQGRPALVLHGGAGPDSVEDVVARLARGCRVLAPTHPGWDDTPRPEWFNGVDDLAITYLDLLEDRNLSDVVVLGSSFGGWVAAEMAVRDRGRRIGHLVLMDAIGPHIPGFEIRPPGPRGPGAPGDSEAPGGPGGPDPQPAAPAAGQTPRRGPSREAMEALQTYGGPSLSDPKLLRRLPRVHTPVLAVWGSEDTVVTPDFGRAYAAAFPHARFEVIPGGGHIPTREAPEATFAVIDTFLTEPA